MSIRTASTVAAYNDLPLNLRSEVRGKYADTGDHGRQGSRRTTRLRPRPTEDAPQNGIVGEDEAREKRIRRVWGVEVVMVSGEVSSGVTCASSGLFPTRRQR